MNPQLVLPVPIPAPGSSPPDQPAGSLVIETTDTKKCVCVSVCLVVLYCVGAQCVVLYSVRVYCVVLYSVRVYCVVLYYVGAQCVDMMCLIFFAGS